jgi:hypothetical protein
MRVALLMSGVAVVGIGGAALGIAWGVAEAGARWSSEPAVRALIGVGIGVAGGGLALLCAKLRPVADSAGARTLAKPEAAGDRGGK